MAAQRAPAGAGRRHHDGGNPLQPLPVRHCLPAAAACPLLPASPLQLQHRLPILAGRKLLVPLLQRSQHLSRLGRLLEALQAAGSASGWLAGGDARGADKPARQSPCAAAVLAGKAKAACCALIPPLSLRVLASQLANPSARPHTCALRSICCSRAARASRSWPTSARKPASSIASSSPAAAATAAAATAAAAAGAARGVPAAAGERGGASAGASNASSRSCCCCCCCEGEPAGEVPAPAAAASGAAAKLPATSSGAAVGDG